jgi:DNA-binding CsgD family transcriptional regulator
MADRRNLTRLTPAELRIVRAILAGHTSAKELVAALPPVRGNPTSPRTIQTHIGRIYAKTGAFNKLDLYLMAEGKKACAIDLVGQLGEPVPRRRGRVRHGTTAR